MQFPEIKPYKICSFRINHFYLRQLFFKETADKINISLYINQKLIKPLTAIRICCLTGNKPCNVYFCNSASPNSFFNFFAGIRILYKNISLFPEKLKHVPHKIFHLKRGTRYEQTGNFRTTDLNFTVTRVGTELEENLKKGL